MQYMLLIYTQEGIEPDYGTPEGEAFIGEYFKFTEEAQQKGLFVAGDALLPSNTATTVKVRDGASATFDGPFAETKEVLGGYYILDCKDLDEAREWAEKIPSARYGSIEIRPVMVFEDH